MFYRSCQLKTMLHLTKISVIKKSIFNKNTVRQLSNTAVEENIIEWDKMKSKYTDKQLTLVLKTLNHSTSEEMKKYGVPENDIELVKASKSKYGSPFKSLDLFISHEIMDTSQLENICSTIVTSKAKQPKKSSVTPPLDYNTIKDLKTAVGLRVGINYISWSQLELTGSNCNILNWDYQSVSDVPLNSNLTEVIKTAANIAKAIPYADAYAMEKESSKPLAKINVSLFRLLIRQQQLMSVIMTILAMRNNLAKSSTDTKDESNDNLMSSFYTMRAKASALHFGLFFGSETVSATEIVEALLQRKNIGLKNLSSVRVDEELLNYYFSLDIYKKEEMNMTLLLALTFIESLLLERIELKC